ncbi:MAG: aldo/keto reductase [Candidatus Rokubacteria bacterium]|nr:aldo/keto reductase [Candidatus Rokubacteria bacterium]
MEQRSLGKSGLSVGAMGLGLMSMSGVYGKPDDDESIRTIHKALDLGVTLLDSSDMYGWGQNEQLLGRALKGQRDRAFVVTKFGQVQNPAGGPNLVDGRPEYVKQACDASLTRLGIDLIDLYFQHRIDPKVPIEDTVGAMSRLVEAGKVRAIGLCEAAPATVRRAHEVRPLAALQSEYSLLYRKEAEEILPTLRELGIAYMAYSPIGRSLLSGTVHSASDLPEGDRRLAHPRFQGENLTKNVGIVTKLEAMAKQKGCTPPQLVLAWLLAQGPDIVPIPGTKRVSRVEENVGALNVKLSADEVQRISEIAPVGAGAGPRYPEAQLKGVYI